ncbi:flagellar motor switch protein FliN [Chitinimonas sp. BJB300]|uniref:flagellar motor switch protein FliN n=1 Tax=Chitinimonas sp. BJB300 TaxID=1559339 RepID=UPI000C0F1137|nr:flagellar motor switch protein FliN [Chitinimonas sp. BJB300]PHV13088.1 flagellar motor switch protein FliN [Chitinimonas sp. BJB300]TSJ84685.1 flagellar motor switch protein FliN [Chitinimonas sp. BJB300]
MSNEEEQGLDDWAAALAEQQTADEAAAAAAAATETEQTAAAAPTSMQNVAPADIFRRFENQSDKPSGPSGIDMILDIPVTMTVELGRTKIAIRSLLQLAQGSVVELDGLAGEPMDVLVNGTLIAQGEVVVVNDKFGIRLTDIITPAERIRRLHK